MVFWKRYKVLQHQVVTYLLDICGSDFVMNSHGLACPDYKER